MKKIITILSSALILAGTACAADSNVSSRSSERNTNQKGNTKVLVAYYSDTGTTKAVAEKIASYLNADLLEIESETPYSSADVNWRNRESRVFREHDIIFGTKGNGQATAEDFQRTSSQVSTRVDSDSVIDLSGYDTVFVGYPIWWGIAAWPVNGFVTQNNLEGKTIVPFATSMSSALGRSDTLLREIAGGKGNWLPGHRFGTSASVSEVRSLVDTSEIK